MNNITWNEFDTKLRSRYEIIKNQSHYGWGAKIIEQISNDLKSAFPDMKGFSLTNLKYMKLFASSFEQSEISQQAADQLPWFHIVTILEGCKNPNERKFYIKQTIENGWSRNILSIQIESNLYSRQGNAITNFDAKLPPIQSDLAHQTLKNPYIFDFLSLNNEAQERDIERALTAHIQKFLLELGTGFSFVGSQYHINVGEKDYYIDMLFYHLKLRSYIVIELKAGELSPRDVGQLNFYLAAVDGELKHKTDNPSIGLLLCKNKGDQITAEYALRNVTSPIGIASYELGNVMPKELQDILPSIEQIENKLSAVMTKEELVGKNYVR